MLKMIGAQAAAGIRSYRDPDAFAGALLGGEFEYLPMPGRPFSATLRILQVGGVLVQRATDSPHISRAALQPGLVGLIVPLHFAGRPPSANGTAIAGHNAILVPGGAEFTVACPDPQEWGAVALPTALAEDLAELGATRPQGDSLGVLDVAPDMFGELSAAFAAAGRMAEEAPDELAAPGCAEGLAASLLEMVAATLAPGLHAPGLRNVSRGRAAREATRVLRTVDEYLRINLDRPIYLDHLCLAVGVSRRKLHDAFLAVVGMSPTAYLKLRRLVLARRALRAGDGSQRLVKSIALSHGFWHLGYFAKDYRALFGELPSQTIATGTRA